MKKFDRDIVLFIGAGFSKEAGLPLMSEFGDEAKKDHERLLKHLNPPDFRKAARMLVNAAETFKKFQAYLYNKGLLGENDIKNIEKVFCQAEDFQKDQNKIVLNGQNYSPDELISDIQLWIWKVYQQLPIFSQNQEPERKSKYEKIFAEVYSPFFNSIRSNVGRITILSTNYDIAYEYLSYKNDLKCTYPFSWEKILWNKKLSTNQEDYIESSNNSDLTMVCKLHGSVNYFENPHKKGELYVATDMYEHKGKDYSISLPRSLLVDSIWEIKTKYGQDINPFIIPPRLNKPLPRYIWDPAAEVLKKAKIIIFIGYSIPDSDKHMISFLKDNISNPLIYVIDPNPKIHACFKDIFGSCKKELEPKEQDLRKAIFKDSLPKILKNIS